MKRPLYRALYVQVLFAIACGVVLGWVRPSLAVEMRPFGDGFIKLIKMIIAPVIFCTIVAGIGGMQDMKKIGRIGGKAILYFEIVSTFALCIGLLVANLIRPGAGFNASAAALGGKEIAELTEKAKGQHTIDFLLNVIPTTLIDAFAKGEVLQVLLLAVLFGFAISAMGERGKPALHFIELAVKAAFGVVNIIMKVAPLGAFGAMAFTIGKYGIASLLPMAKLVGSVYVTCILFVVMVLGAIGRIAGFSVLRLVSYIREELLIVLGTSSSETVLPSLMIKLEGLGCSKSVVGLVVPSGYAFNPDGTNIYMTMAALFIAQATNTPLTLGQELTILTVAMLTSKGASGITGAGFVALTSTLTVVPSIPVSGMALILGIDRFMSEARALTNVIGNSVATVVIARWENELDREKLATRLRAGPDSQDAAALSVTRHNRAQ